MRPMLERADKGHVACYLETENERNVAFYRKHGFEVIVNGEEAGATGVRFWTFSRAPKR
jgi:ribosomal protein S18 acetylase RimI-like enzyme